MIEAIFFDIDGTLLSLKTHQIPTSTIQALCNLQKKGIKLFIATGRGKENLEVLNDFLFDGYITLNGQYCFDKNHQIIYKNELDKEDIQEIINYVTTYQIACSFKTEFGKFYNLKNELVDELHKITNDENFPIDDAISALNYQILQIGCFINKEQEKELMEKLKHSSSTRWLDTFCDISPHGGTKALGIEKVCQYFGIDMNKTMAFGDAFNDLEMLECVKIGVAMGNACDELKILASYVTKDVDDDGIEAALKYFQLI